MIEIKSGIVSRDHRIMIDSPFQFPRIVHSARHNRIWIDRTVGHFHLTQGLLLNLQDNVPAGFKGLKIRTDVWDDENGEEMAQCRRIQ